MFVNVAQLFPNGFGKGCVMGFRLGLAQCCHPSDGDVVAMADKWACRASDAGVDFLVFPECTTLFEQFIHQSGFTMVNMGDDRYITNIFSGYLHKLPSFYKIEYTVISLVSAINQIILP